MNSLWTLKQWRDAYTTRAIQLNDLFGYVESLSNDDHAWISIANREQLDAQIEALATQNLQDLPLFGVPFAVKDNIDVAGFYTTAACEAARYLATEDATVVAQLKKAGAIVIGKTNLDQFATGLVGVRSPYGAVKNSFNPEYISGGSSSGSSVLVAKGIVPFSLGTDTAGSGRVPAGHNNIVGLKPTKGWFSKHGLVPACYLLDVISIFALTVDDAWQVAQIMQGFDPQDRYSRVHPANVPTQFSKQRIAIPDQLEFYGDTATQQAFELAIAKLHHLGYCVEEIDFTAFNHLASSLYQDAWVAERTVAAENCVTRDQTHPVIGNIIAQADQFSATDAMKAEYQRAEDTRQIHQILSEYDALMVPTSPTIYTIAEVEADPIVKNSHQGAYTNFVNLADLSALALPNTFRPDGLPTGVTFIAPAWHDQALANFGRDWQAQNDLCLGTSQLPYEEGEFLNSPHSVKLAVVGAHLSGMPLNFQLTTRLGTLLYATKTAPHYQLYALKGTTPAKPALQYVEKGGCSIEVEVWDIPLAHFGAIVAEVPAPLGIGNLQLKSGQWVKGFICESHVLNPQHATEISHFGGWRDYMHAQKIKNTSFQCLCIGEVSQ